MIDFFSKAAWAEFTGFLAAGEPPMFVRLLALNALFFVFFALRRARGVAAMREWSAIKVQVLLVLANALVLFQVQIQALIRSVI
jgi:hypothetical protein